MYRWIALYDDRTQLNQFDGEKENKFGDIDQEKLLAFKILDDKKRHLLVDVKLGVFFINGTVYEIPGVSHKLLDYRLIYYRRVQQSMGTAPGMQDKSENSFIGFQVNIDGKNKKVIMEVDKDCVVKIHM